MTDRELIQRCAEVISLRQTVREYQKKDCTFVDVNGVICHYDPLASDAQAAELESYLLKRGAINVSQKGFLFNRDDGTYFFEEADMRPAEARRRAIVRCVAGMGEKKAPPGDGRGSLLGG